MKSKEKTFAIDFFEFSFLVEACIPPRPIARAMFWEKVINIHYHKLSVNERKRLFDWIIKNPSFSLSNADCKLFYNRFNPDNQYSVTTRLDDKVKVIECFMHEGQYQLTSTSSINEKFIIDVKTIIYNEN